VKRRFRLTPEARADLREILLDIATDSPDAAERLRSEFHEAFQRLAQTPGIRRATSLRSLQRVPARISS
jgi:plasmid stabilization system protein ParE